MRTIGGSMSSTFHILPLRFRAYMRHPKVHAAWLTFFWGLTLFYFLFCALVLTTRWVLLPQVDKYKDDIAAFLSKSLHAEVSIGRIAPRWDTFWPQLSMADVVIKRPDPRSNDEHILHLPRIEASLYWRSFLGTPLFRHLEIPGAEVTVRRVGSNAWDIAGFFLDFDRRPQKKESGSQTADWLLSQGRIDITDCRVRYVDLTATPEPRSVTIENINFTFESGINGYRAGLQGRLAGRRQNVIDLRAAFSAPYFGDRGWKTWSGDLYVELDNLDAGRLVRPFEPALGVLQQGRGSTRSWIAFDEGRLTELSSSLQLADVKLSLKSNARPLEVKSLSVQLTEAFEEDRLYAKADNLDFVLADGTAARDLALEANVLMAKNPQPGADRSTFRVAFLDLATLKRLLPSVSLPASIADLLHKHEAGGSVSNLEFSWAGSPGKPSDWRLKTDFSGLTVSKKAAGKKTGLQGFSNLTGTLEASAGSGRVTFVTSEAVLTLPGVFENPDLALTSLTGSVGWKMEEPEGSAQKRLALTFENLSAANQDAAATVNGLWRDNGSKAGYIDLKGNIARASAKQAWRYLPLVIPEKVRDWLQGGLAAGTVTNGVLELKGELARFPWVDENAGKGRFYVAGDLSGGAIDYAPSMKVLSDGSFERGSVWPLLTDIKGRLVFEGAGMTVTAQSAKTGGADVGGVRAVIPDLTAGNETRLVIDGKAKADMQAFFDYVEASPVKGFVAGAFTGTRASGSGSLDLHLDIPLMHAHDTKVEGAISMTGAVMEMGWPKPPLKDVTGTVHFSEKGARATGLNARAFGSGDASVSVITARDGSIVINAAGKTDVSNLGWFARTPYLTPVLEKMSGMLPFVSTIVVKKAGGVTVSARSSLEGIQIALPAPLAKSADKTWDTAFSFTPVVVSGKKGYQINVSSGRRFNVALQLAADGSTLPVRGRIAVGGDALLPTRGIAVNVRAEELTLLSWQPFVQKLLETAKAQKAQTGGAKAGDGAALSEITVDAKRLVLEDGIIHNSTGRFAFDAAENVDIALDSDEIKGRLRYEPAGRGSVTGSFSKLHLSAKGASTLRRFLQGETVDVVLTSRPTVLPSLDLVADEFTYDGMKIGRMLLQADATGTADAETLHIKNFAVFSEASALTGTGQWTQGRRLQNKQSGQTSFDLSLTTRDLGRTLTDLGIGGVIENTTGTAQGHFMFDGLPWAPKLDTLTGSYSINMRKGTISKVDTGAGGLLLSFVSMQSLFKRLTLDFSDFKDGFSFDTLTASSIIADGVLSSDNTKIVGTHGTILISGNVNIARGTVDSRAIVLPDINAGNASLALAFVNPAVGIGSFLAQLVLRTPLSHLFKVEYTIKGPWQNPEISKVSSSGGKEDAEEKR